MSYGMVRSNSGTVGGRATDYRTQFNAIREGIKLGRQMVSRGGSWASAGRSGPASFTPTWRANPSPPYQYKRRPVSQGGPSAKRSKTTGTMTSARFRSSGGSARSKIVRARKGSSKKRSYRKKKFRKSKRPPTLTNGIVGRIETIQKVQDLNAVYIGHTNFPVNQVLEYVARAITKAFWAKEGILVENDLTVGPSVPHVWRFIYFDSPVDTTPNVIDSIAMVANTTFGTAFGNLAIAMRTLMDSADNLFKWQTLTWLSTPTSSDYRFKHDANMVQTKIMGTVRSLMTMQNSTPNASDTNETDVNNANPLQCTKYHGSGNGTEMVVRTSTIAGPPVYTSFIADPSRGNIAVVAKQAIGLHLDEPPTPRFFAGCKGGGKFTLQPGSIAKSTLYDSYNMSLSSYMNVMRGHLITIRQKIRKGRYEFFGFEKVVTTSVSGGLSDVPITVDYEIDHKFAFKCVIKTKQMTLPVNTTQVALPILTVP